MTLDTMFRISSGSGISVVLSTTAGQKDYMGCVYNTVDTTLDVVSYVPGFGG
jgi:hypothetical protein